MDNRLQPFKEAAAKVLDRLKGSLASLQIGRASPSLVENITVEAYGSPVPLLSLGNIQAPEPRLLVIQPWDKGTLKDIEKALIQANLGASPVVDGAVIRINFPLPTEERRLSLAKEARKLAEEAKVALKGPRENLLKTWKEAEKNGELSEDIHFQLTEDLQKLVEELHQEIKTMADKKEKEITTL